MDLALTLRTGQPPPLITDSSAKTKKEFDMWDRSNRTSLMGTIFGEVTTTKEFLDDIEKHFVKNDKGETNTFLGSLVSMKYQGQGNIREYIIHMSNITSKLKALKLELFDDLLMQELLQHIFGNSILIMEKSHSRGFETLETPNMFLNPSI